MEVLIPKCIRHFQSWTEEESPSNDGFASKTCCWKVVQTWVHLISSVVVVWSDYLIHCWWDFAYESRLSNFFELKLLTPIDLMSPFSTQCSNSAHTPLRSTCGRTWSLVQSHDAILCSNGPVDQVQIHIIQFQFTANIQADHKQKKFTDQWAANLNLFLQNMWMNQRAVKSPLSMIQKGDEIRLQLLQMCPAYLFF
jgi:hypothetical protein